MSQQTEAQCLIEQGAMFPCRQGFLDTKTGGTILIGFKTGACSIYFDDAPIYHFDLEGRWQRAFVAANPDRPDTPKNLAGVPGTHYLKALDTTAKSLVRLREGNEIKIRRRQLSFAEAVRFDDQVRQVAMSLFDGIASNRLNPIDPPREGRAAAEPLSRDELLDFFERVATWDAARWSRQRENFMATYGPWPMSPPALPGPIVLQATLGDSGEKGVGFGGSRTTPLYVRNVEEFERHVGRVVELWGRRLSQARGIHLAGADLIVQPMPVVIDILEATARILGDSQPGDSSRTIDPARTMRKTDIHLMTHRLDCPPPTPEAFREYKHRGLMHLTIGVESIHQEVLRVLGRSWNAGGLNSWLASAAEADLPVSIVWLVGTGGKAFEEHFEATAQFMAQIEWQPGTLVYLVDAAETAEGAMRGSLGIRDENAALIRNFQGFVAAPLKSAGVRVIPYTIDKEWQ